MSPNKSLQRSGTHKVLGRGRPSLLLHSLLRARVLKGRRAAAELSRWATDFGLAAPTPVHHGLGLLLRLSKAKAPGAATERAFRLSLLKALFRDLEAHELGLCTTLNGGS